MDEDAGAEADAEDFKESYFWFDFKVKSDKKLKEILKKKSVCLHFHWSL